MSFGRPAVAAHRRQPGHQEGDVQQPRHEGRHADPRDRGHQPQGRRRPRAASSRSARRRSPSPPAARPPSTSPPTPGWAARSTARYSAYVTATGGGQTVRTAAGGRAGGGVVRRHAEVPRPPRAAPGPPHHPVPGRAQRQPVRGHVHRRHGHPPRPQGPVHPRLAQREGPELDRGRRRLAGTARAERHQGPDGHARPEQGPFGRHHRAGQEGQAAPGHGVLRAQGHTGGELRRDAHLLRHPCRARRTRDAVQPGAGLVRAVDQGQGRRVQHARRRRGEEDPPARTSTITRRASSPR